MEKENTKHSDFGFVVKFIGITVFIFGITFASCGIYLVFSVVVDLYSMMFLKNEIDTQTLRLHIVFIPITLSMGFFALACLLPSYRNKLFRAVGWSNDEYENKAVTPWDPNINICSAKVSEYVPQNKLILLQPYPSFMNYVTESFVISIIGPIFYIFLFGLMILFVKSGFFAAFIGCMLFLSVFFWEYRLYSSATKKRSEQWHFDLINKILYCDDSKCCLTQFSQITIQPEETRIFRGENISHYYDVVVELVNKEGIALKILNTGQLPDLNEAKYHALCFANTLAEVLEITVCVKDAILVEDRRLPDVEKIATLFSGEVSSKEQNQF